LFGYAGSRISKISSCRIGIDRDFSGFFLVGWVRRFAAFRFGVAARFSVPLAGFDVFAAEGT
jgi:hypothetical protein